VTKSQKDQFNSSKSQTLIVREKSIYISTHKGTSDFCHPSENSFSFDSYLIGIEEHKINNEFNFIMSNGDRSGGMSEGKKISNFLEPRDCEVKRVVVNYDPSGCVTGFTFYDKERKCVL